MTRFRTGIGHDVHGLFPDHELVLGGVVVSTEVGFNTHSDGDVLSHALIDALAGAIADGDLGTHYPENDPDAEDARSLDFVKEFGGYVRRAGYEIPRRLMIRARRHPLQPDRLLVRERSDEHFRGTHHHLQNGDASPFAAGGEFPVKQSGWTH
jgi:2-C-methyl-D-erythritol 2,4-cyclodiphosphate synthase